MAVSTGLTRYGVGVSHEPCPHCGADRVYGVPENNLQARPEPATCACGGEGPPNLPYSKVAEKVYEASCESLTNRDEFTCRCGQPVTRGIREDQEVLTHKMPQCRAFLDYGFDEFIAWIESQPN